MVHRTQERVDVARFAAAEAVIEADLRSDVKAGALLVVERTQALKRADTGRFQRYALSDDVTDVRPRFDLVDVCLPNSGHQRAPSPTTRPGACARDPAPVWRGLQIPTSAGSMSPTRRPCQSRAV